MSNFNWFGWKLWFITERKNSNTDVAINEWPIVWPNWYQWKRIRCNWSWPRFNPNAIAVSMHIHTGDWKNTFGLKLARHFEIRANSCYRCCFQFDRLLLIGDICKILWKNKIKKKGLIKRFWEKGEGRMSFIRGRYDILLHYSSIVLGQRKRKIGSRDNRIGIRLVKMKSISMKNERGKKKTRWQLYQWIRFYKEKDSDIVAQSKKAWTM